MKTSLTINATRAGKKVAKSFGYVNPDVANSLVGGFAQMVNALSNDTFVNAEVVKKMDTTEEEQTTPTPTPAPAGKQEGIITVNVNGVPISYGQEIDGGTITYTYNGDANHLDFFNGDTFLTVPASGGTLTYEIKTRVGYFLCAPPTDNFTSAGFFFYYSD